MWDTNRVLSTVPLRLRSLLESITGVHFGWKSRLHQLDCKSLEVARWGPLYSFHTHGSVWSRNPVALKVPTLSSFLGCAFSYIGGVHCFLAAVPQIWGCWAPEPCSGLGSWARRLLHGIYGALARLSRLLPALLLLLDSTCLDTGRRSSCSCELSARDHKLVRLRDAAAGDHRTSARPAAGADRASCMGPDSRSLDVGHLTGQHPHLSPHVSIGTLAIRDSLMLLQPGLGLLRTV